MFHVKPGVTYQGRQNDPRGNSRQNYIVKKLDKLDQELQEHQISTLFLGLTFWLNAIPNMQQLRIKIGQYGGKVLFQYRTGVTHLVCINLSQAKYNMYKQSTKVKIIYPQYIDDCIKANKVLPEEKYLYNYNKVQLHESNTENLLDFKMTKQEFDQAFSIPQYNNEQQQIQQHIQKLMERNTQNDYYCSYQPYIQKNNQVISNSQSQSPQPFNLAQYYQELQQQKQKQIIQVLQTENYDYWQHSRLHMLNEYKLDAQQFLLENPPCGPTPIQTEQQLYLHIDIDCFFVQGSLLAMTLSERQKYQDKPIAITSVKQIKDDSTADISSCNYIARQYGVKNGMWIKQALKLCPNLQFINYNFDYYKILSRKFYNIIRYISSDIMPVSCDEAYIRINGLVDNKEQFMINLKEQIKEQLGMTCSIGMGSQMVIARIATKLCKPNGYKYLTKVEFLEQTQQKAISFIPGIGDATEQLLNQLEIKTVGQLRGITLFELQQNFGQQKGQNIQNLANGVDNIQFKPVANIFNNNQLQINRNYNIQIGNYQQLENIIESMLLELEKRNSIRKIQINKILIQLKIQSKLNNPSYQKYLGTGLCDNIQQYILIEQNKKYSYYANQFAAKFSEMVQFDKIKGISVTGFKSSQINQKQYLTNIDQYIYNKNQEIQLNQLIAKIEQNGQDFASKYEQKDKIQTEYIDNLEIFSKDKQILIKILQIQLQYWSKRGNFQKVKQILNFIKSKMGYQYLDQTQEYNYLDLKFQ